MKNQKEDLMKNQEKIIANYKSKNSKLNAQIRELEAQRKVLQKETYAKLPSVRKSYSLESAFEDLVAGRGGEDVYWLSEAIKGIIESGEEFTYPELYARLGEGVEEWIREFCEAMNREERYPNEEYQRKENFKNHFHGLLDAELEYVLACVTDEYKLETLSDLEFFEMLSSPIQKSVLSKTAKLIDDYLYDNLEEQREEHIQADIDLYEYNARIDSQEFDTDCGDCEVTDSELRVWLDEHLANLLAVETRKPIW